MASNLLSRGDLFAGRYRIERAIGAGGMGAVFEAEHLETERRVALKVLLPQSLTSDTARDRFKQEARVAGKIRHPHIVDVIDAGVDDITNMPYLVMELLHGEDLGSRVDRLGPMTPDETVRLLAQVAGALDCLHERSIVHRDLKPENMFLTWADDGSRVTKLLDFGVAKVLAEGKSSAFTLDAQGTPVYMAPEQFAEQIRISAATDIYALGMVAFTLLTGKHYWGPEIARGMNVFMLARVAEGGPREPATRRAERQGAKLPPAFDEWFSIVTAIAPGERYPTAGDAIEALSDALGLTQGAPSSRRMPPRSGPISVDMPPSTQKTAAASTPPLPLRPPKPFWRRPTLMTATLLGVVCVAAYAVLLVPRLRTSNAPAALPPPLESAPRALQPAAAAEPPTASAPSDPASTSTSPPLASVSASSAVPAPASATEEPPEEPPPATVSASRHPPPPRPPWPASTKRPKYTRE